MQVCADGESVIFRTGIAAGPVDLGVEVLDGAPADILHAPSPPWQEAQQVTIVFRRPLYLTAPTTDSGIPGPVLIPTTPGLHILLVEAWGRSTHRDHFVDTPVEAYRLRLWPTG